MGAPNEYKLRVPDEIASLIRGLHPRIKGQIKAAFGNIIVNPYCGKALKDELEGLRSFKVKRYRIIYRISPRKELEVVVIGPRRNIYEETFRIIQKEQKQR